jgi:hypothetical protein
MLCNREVEPMLKRIFEKRRGAVSPDWMLMATVLVLGSVAVLAATRVALYGSVDTWAKALTGM